jgi:hypothetical protein
MANSRGLLKARQAKPTSPKRIDQHEVARVAYELYVQRGRTDGRDLDDWLKAEALLRQRASARLNA